MHQTDEIQLILERNKRVEMDKSWEVSWTRRIFIAVITFVAAFLFLNIIEAPQALLAAFIPTGGYILSTLSLKPLRALWQKFH